MNLREKDKTDKFEVEYVLIGIFPLTKQMFKSLNKIIYASNKNRHRSTQC